MPIDKVYASFADAVADVPDSSVIMMDGFGGPGGMPQQLILALRDQGAKDLTIISNTAGLPGFGAVAGQEVINHSVLVENNQVRKIIASFPVSPSASRPNAFELAYREGKVELEVLPQGTLAERIRAGGAGIPAFYTPTGVGTVVAEGKEVRVFNGREHLMETGLTADYAFLRAYKSDTLGNTTYRGSSRNFNAVMATAARITVVEVEEILQPGELDPEAIATPGIFVHRIVRR